MLSLHVLQRNKVATANLFLLPLWYRYLLFDVQPSVGFSLIYDRLPFFSYLQPSSPLIQIGLKLWPPSSSHIFLGLSLVLLPAGLQIINFWAIAPSLICVTYLGYLTLPAFMNLTISAFSIKQPNSWLVLIVHPSWSRTASNIFLNIFLTNILSFSSSNFLIIYTPFIIIPYVAVGLIILKYIFNIL